MSITIRLNRIGRKKAPAFSMVVANTRDKRNGRYLDRIGHYNPSTKPVTFSYDKKKFEEWVKKGAITSDTVLKLIEGKYEFVPYIPAKQEKATREKPETQEKQSEKTEESSASVEETSE